MKEQIDNGMCSPIRFISHSINTGDLLFLHSISFGAALFWQSWDSGRCVCKLIVCLFLFKSIWCIY